MFASLSSFFPSTLQQLTPATRPQDQPVSLLVSTPAPAADPPRKKEKKDKEKLPNEAFIIVRPPPSKSNQPLSLQVQLVPPQSRHDRPVQALDSSPPEDLDMDLRRTHSNRSETSSQSGYASGSVSSFVSTSTSGSGRRMIIPLYNLNVHSVMPSTILDAGTDAKVAKFAKRGLEVIGLAFLEPIEVRPSTPANCSLLVPARLSLDDSRPEFGSALGLSLSRPPLAQSRPNTSHAPINASWGQPHKPAIIAPPLDPPDAPPQRSNKKLFSRMFKKKDAAPPVPIAVKLPDGTTTPQPSPLPNSVCLPAEVPASQPLSPNHHDGWSSSFTSTIASQTAVLGVHSTLYPPVGNPKGRPTKYVWVVRKWLKGTDTSILNGVMGKLSAGARDSSLANTSSIEVRFEWSREQKKGNGRKQRADKNPKTRESPDPGRHRTQSNTKQTLSPDLQNPRISIISHISSGSDTATSHGSHPHVEELGEDSDPEDSETPWTCTVAVQRLGQLPQHDDKGVREPDIHLKVATLAPTPHHPKIVGLLKVPFPLPDIEVERLTVRRRLVTAQGISKTTVASGAEFVLTAEEIKDSVSSTALWLVVREAFGGVGRERKKGKS